MPEACQLTQAIWDYWFLIAIALTLFVFAVLNLVWRHNYTGGRPKRYGLRAFILLLAGLGTLCVFWWMTPKCEDLTVRDIAQPMASRATPSR